MHALFIWTIGFEASASSRRHADGAVPENRCLAGPFFLRDLVHLEHPVGAGQVRVQFFHHGLRPTLEQMLRSPTCGNDDIWLIADALHVDEGDPSWRPLRASVDGVSADEMLVSRERQHAHLQPIQAPFRRPVRMLRRSPPTRRESRADDGACSSLSRFSYDEVICALAHISADTLRRYASRMPAPPDLALTLIRAAASSTFAAERPSVE
jgi:hypothetical protein